MFLATASVSEAATVILRQGSTPTTDYEIGNAGIREDNPNGNYGASPSGTAGRLTGPTGSRLRSVFSYSLSAIPAGATIDSISMFLRGEKDDPDSVTGQFVFDLHALSGSFVEGTSNNGNTSIGFVTWNNRTTSTGWGTPGGTFSSTVLSSINVNSEENAGVNYTFQSSSDFVAAAQLALDGGTPLALLLKLSDETLTGRRIFFYDTDDATVIANRPALVINYTIPEPATAMLAALAGAGFMIRRRRGC